MLETSHRIGVEKTLIDVCYAVKSYHAWNEGLHRGRKGLTTPAQTGLFTGPFRRGAGTAIEQAEMFALVSHHFEVLP